MTTIEVATTREVPQRGPLEFRHVGTIGEVSFPHRRITLVVMPYEQEALVEYRGRLIKEICTAGAYEGLEHRSKPPRAFRDHDRKAIFGHAATLHPESSEGLVAELEVFETPLGDETLALAKAGGIDASAGFNVLHGGERWSPDRSSRRLTRLWLDHIAMTAEPAYPGARVLDVRHAVEADLSPRSPTPRKDELLAKLRALGYDPSQQ
jgi:HK97 family phage prohead protease